MSTEPVDDRQRFFALIAESLGLSGVFPISFARLTLSRPGESGPDSLQPRRVDFRLITVRGQESLSANYRYHRRDETKNFPVPEFVALVKSLLAGAFMGADLRCQGFEHSLRIDRKGVAHLISRRSAVDVAPPETTIQAHNRAKLRPVGATTPWLQLVGISDQEGVVMPRMQDKFRQINKFVEILDDLVQAMPADLSVVDMGSGKAYLTFALYHHLKSRFQIRACGVEQRPELVAKCNSYAVEAGFAPESTGACGLSFVEGSIAAWRPAADSPWCHPSVLVALHACDTATDDALAFGIRNQARLIICSPCCHKQLRADMKADGIFGRITRFGILEERLAEILTDSVRALLLEAHGFKVKVFEFVSAEHTGKNVMISAIRQRDGVEASFRTAKLAEAHELLRTFGVSRHYLLELLAD